MGVNVSNEPIPFLDLVTPHRELEEELVERVPSRRFARPRSSAESRSRRSNGSSRAYCGAKYCVGVANGTDAVRFALMASGVGRGDAVVTVSHTFIATVEAISQAGAETEFVDIDERTYCMSPEALDEYLTRVRRRTQRPADRSGQRTGKPIKAIVPVHLYGQVADMDAILAIAARYDLLVIEDACQAHGAEYRRRTAVWRRAGTFGKAAAFSFYPGKNLGACGEAGAVTTDDEQIAKTIKMLREHGQAKKYYHDLEGYNGRLDAIQAAFLRVKLRHLDDWNAAASRRPRPDTPSSCRPMPSVTVPFEPEHCKAVYHLYVIRSAEPRCSGGAPEVSGSIHRLSLSAARCTCRNATATGVIARAVCR